MEDKNLELRMCLRYLKTRLNTTAVGLGPRISFIHRVSGLRLGDAIRLLYRIEKEKDDGKTNQGS
jgi:hypothetical protein